MVMILLFLLLPLIMATTTTTTSTKTHPELILKCKVHYLNKCDRHCNVCESENLNVTAIDTLLTEVTGFSVRNVAFHNNVIRLSINNQICQFLPLATENFFPNLETLRIWSSQLKVLHKKNLKGFPQLRELLVPLNELESLNSDLFQFNPKITRIDFSRNRLKNVGLAFFGFLKGVTFASFNNNPCIDENLRGDQQTFADKLREQCLPTLEQLKNDVILLANENERLKVTLEARETFIGENCKVHNYFLSNDDDDERNQEIE